MRLLFTLILIAQSLVAFSQTTASIGYSTLIGTWKVLSKIEIKKSDGQVIGQNQEVYKPDEKFFEFSQNSTVTISQEFGKHSEKLPVSMKGKNLYIGKIKKTKIPYLVRYDGKLLKLAKTEGKIKKGKTILETEEVILERK
ncbi:hypothetical protein [Dyadobacter sp. CY356]|uniref:hypothetical protein n=1 Tax=Dyadobacter sp. CY356 TaxID=2906442 RepID=UPI001F2E4D5A|nr:hypothetical protein [Dyadobacter sp. CY356]MCF0059190.1 hypothetical protein [Dyadobacter sp. CY356]